MNTLVTLGIISAFIYSFMVDSTFMKIYLGLLTVWTVILEVFFRNRSMNGKRKLVSITTWHGKDITLMT